MRALNVIEAAYRGTLEEQDDTIVWLTHAIKGAGADLDVLLCGNAVNYAVRAQEVQPLSFGDRQQKNGPRIADDVAALLAKDIAVFVLSEDLADRGIGHDELIDGLQPISRSEQPGLYAGYDHVWLW